MKTIKTLKDIELLRSEKVIPEDYLEHVENYFNHLHESLNDGEPLDEFSLQQHGYIVLLERGDNVRDLSCVGLGPNINGLLGCRPEYLERYDLDSISFYKILVMYNNEYAMTFFTEKGIHDNEVEEWLDKRCYPEKTPILAEEGWGNLFKEA